MFFLKLMSNFTSTNSLFSLHRQAAVAVSGPAVRKHLPVAVRRRRVAVAAVTTPRATVVAVAVTVMPVLITSPPPSPSRTRKTLPRLLNEEGERRLYTQPTSSDND